MYTRYIRRELLKSKCSSFYHQFGIETLLLLLNVLRFYALDNIPTIQLRREIRSEKHVLASEENYWRLSVLRSTINPRNVAKVIEQVQV